MVVVVVVGLLCGVAARGPCRMCRAVAHSGAPAPALVALSAALPPAAPACHMAQPGTRQRLALHTPDAAPPPPSQDSQEGVVSALLEELADQALKELLLAFFILSTS